MKEREGKIDADFFIRSVVDSAPDSALEAYIAELLAPYQDRIQAVRKQKLKDLQSSVPDIMQDSQESSNI